MVYLGFSRVSWCPRASPARPPRPARGRNSRVGVRALFGQARGFEGLRIVAANRDANDFGGSKLVDAGPPYVDRDAARPAGTQTMKADDDRAAEVGDVFELQAVPIKVLEHRLPKRGDLV